MKKQVILDKIGTLYSFVEAGSNRATEEYARGAFELMKRRMELLFPEYFEVVPT
jgi:hypothetical protein